MIDYNNFLNQVGVKLQLPENKYNELKKNYDALTQYIDSKHVLSDGDGEMYVQGSFAIDTAIVPLKGNDVDVDMVARFSDLWFAGIQVQPFYDKLVEVFKEGRYADIYEEHKSVIRINYSNDYHFDIMPVLKKDNSQENKRIKGVHIEENQKKWVDRAPKLYKDWYDTRAACYAIDSLYYTHDSRMNLREMAVTDLPKPNYYSDKPPLTRTIQIIKRARDSFFYDYDEFIPQSIVLTTMIAKIYDNERDIDRFLIKVCNYFYGLAAEKKRFTVVNPANDQEDFTSKWKENNEYYSNFNKFAYWIYYKLINLLTTDNKKHFQRHLEDLFGQRTANQLYNNNKYLYGFWEDSTWKPNQYLSQDKLIEDTYTLNLQYPIQISNSIQPIENTFNRKARKYISRILKIDPIQYNQKLVFTVDVDGIMGNYDIYWKVRNLVESEQKYDQIRGAINQGKYSIEEHSNFNGNHYVECYIVRDREVIAADRISVPIHE